MPPSSSIDEFTRRRALKVVEEHRARTGTLPTLQDLAALGLAEATVDALERAQVLEKRYVTLTSGAVVKGYAVHVPE